MNHFAAEVTNEYSEDRVSALPAAFRDRRGGARRELSMLHLRGLVQRPGGGCAFHTGLARKVGSVLFVLALILLAANVSLLVMQRLPKPEPAGAVPAVDPAEFAELSSQVGKLEAKLAALSKTVEAAEKRESAKPAAQPAAANDNADVIRVDLHPARQA